MRSAAVMNLRTLYAVGLTLMFSVTSALSDVIYENGFPADASFFPIGVWLQSPVRAPQYKAIGINTFVGLWEGPTELQLSELAQAGMFAVAEQNSVGLNSRNRYVIKAWMQGDEPDNAQPIGLGLYGTVYSGNRSRASFARNEGARSDTSDTDQFWPGHRKQILEGARAVHGRREIL